MFVDVFEHEWLDQIHRIYQKYVNWGITAEKTDSSNHTQADGICIRSLLRLDY